MKDRIEAQTPLLTVRELESVRALFTGDASHEQQLLAVEVIRRKFCRHGEMAYIPGDTHAMTFLAGRQFVADRMDLFATKPMDKLRAMWCKPEDEAEDPRRVTP